MIQALLENRVREKPPASASPPLKERVRRLITDGKLLTAAKNERSLEATERRDFLYPA
ncbi:MAG TPA: hypothetical protein VJH24_01405 [Candidatus Bilamarchaeaceae archaeon]|nr:hypothetical protein [Candidatus Bilamarchaeaceae archaeon]